ncbi:YadA-like family protein, partial [Aliarcobacter butzleri]|uniref:YadA-like family protein n=1 Tax=Aliarcobacter butzleri TaxID=28197 RepID=UPI003AF81E02
SSLFGANVDTGFSNTIVGDNNNLINVSSFNTVSGDSNTLDKADYNTVTGNNNTIIDDTGNGSAVSWNTNNTIIGNNNKLSKPVDGADSNMIIGSSNTLEFSRSVYIFGDGNILKSNTNTPMGQSFIVGYLNSLADISNINLTGTNNTLSRVHTSNIQGEYNDIFLASGNLFGSNNIVGDTTKPTEWSLNYGIIGNYNKLNGSDNYIIGAWNEINGSGSYAFGKQNIITGNNSFAFGNNINITGDNIVSFGSKVVKSSYIPIENDDLTNKKYVDDKFSSISTGGGGIDMAIVDSKDSTVLSTSMSYTDYVFSSYTGTGGTGITESQVNNKIEALEKRSKDYTDEKINMLDNKIDNLEKTLREGYRSATATAIALGVSPVLSNGNKNAIGIGLGHYEGENAIAVNYIAELNKNVHMQLGTALNSDTTALKGGISFGF